MIQQCGVKVYPEKKVHVKNAPAGGLILKVPPESC